MPRALSEIYLEDATIDGVPYPSQGGHPISLTYLNEALSPFFPLLSGWAPAIETWEYASSTSFSISGDKRDKYQKGDKIRLKQGGDWKYFYITGVSYSEPNTIVTITGGSDYTLANAAITDNHYSKAMNPQGWPVSLGQRVGDKEIWHEGNDGAGSGLDADTIAGWPYFNFPMLKGKRSSIPGGANLNTYILPGTFVCYTSAAAGTIINVPAGSAFKLTVNWVLDNSDYIVQRFEAYNNEIYYRYSSDGGATWNAWKRIWHTGNTKILIWSGSWSSGSITIPNLPERGLFSFYVDGYSTLIMVYRRGNYFRGIGGRASPLETTQFEATISGDVVTMVACNAITHTASGGHGAAPNRAISQIYLLI